MKNPFILSLFGINILLLGIFFITHTYPFIFILLHITSIFAAWLYVIRVEKIKVFIPKHKVDIILSLLLFLLAFCVRINQVDIVTPGLQGDELIVAQSGIALLRSSFTPFIFSNHGHGTLLPYLIGESISIFGRTIFAIRLPSVLFGALSITALYVLLRQILKKNISFAACLLFVFSYSHIALSRLAFESAPSIFFQIVAGIFLYLSLKTKNLRYFAGLGLALGIGNYTYLDFRMYTFITLSIVFGYMLFQKYSFSQKMRPFLFTIAFLFISVTPLFHYAFTHVDQMTNRAGNISIFNQGLTGMQIIGHMAANIEKTVYVFIPPGDPNGRINPGDTSMFDVVTTLFFLIGFIYLFKKKRKMWIVVCCLFLSALLSDVLTKESGPAAGSINSFNGFGHPNFMRIEGFIPLVFFTLGFGMYVVQKITKFYSVVLIGALICISAYTNYVSYFYQPINWYTYTNNGTNDIYIANYISANFSGKKIYLSPKLKNSLFVQFFSNTENSFYTFKAGSLEDAKKTIQISDVTIIDAKTNATLTQELYKEQNNGLPGYSFNPHIISDNSDNYLEDLIYIKN